MQEINSKHGRTLQVNNNTDDGCGKDGRQELVQQQKLSMSSDSRLKSIDHVLKSAKRKSA